MKIENTEIFTMHADFCKTLSNPKRLMILAMLGRREMCVGEMAETMGVSMANVSQHLNILKSRSIVGSRKEGQTAYYHLEDERLLQACRLIRLVLIDSMKRSGLAAGEINPENIVTDD